MSRPIFELILPANVASFAPLAGCLRETAALLGFDPEESSRIELVAEEAAKNIIEHAYEPGSNETFKVSVRVEMGRMILRLEDHGIPFDALAVPQFDPAAPESGGLGFLLMRHFADAVRLINLGRAGKALEITKRLPNPELDAWLNQAAVPQSGEAEVDSSSVSIRRFEARDAVQVGRCAYRVYGYSYLGEHLYEPERLIEMNQKEELVSVVAVTPEQDVVGHIAMVFSGTRNIAEVGQAFVMPNVRGGGLFKKMKDYLLSLAVSMGLEGVYSESVTVHPYTQLGNLRMGARECGVIPGFVPAGFEFKAIAGSGEAVSQRQTVVLFWNALRQQEQAVRIYLPSHHAGKIQGLYERMGRKFELLSRAQPENHPPQKSRLEVRAIKLWGMGFIKIEEAGEDILAELAKQRHQLCVHGCEILILDLRLDDAFAVNAAAGMEIEGFFFVGVIPSLFGGMDALRFAYLNNQEIDASKIHFASRFAIAHFEYLCGNGAGESIKGSPLPCVEEAGVASAH